MLNREQVERFVGLIDDWSELTMGLSTVRLAEGSWGFGYGGAHTIAVRAFPKDMRVPVGCFDAFARRVLALLDVPCRDGCFEFDAPPAHGLLDVFTHELGHHVDARSARSLRPERGEAFAIQFSADRLGALWPRYQRAFEI